MYTLILITRSGQLEIRVISVSRLSLFEHLRCVCLALIVCTLDHSLSFQSNCAAWISANNPQNNPQGDGFSFLTHPRTYFDLDGVFPPPSLRYTVVSTFRIKTGVSLGAKSIGSLK